MNENERFKFETCEWNLLLFQSVRHGPRGAGGGKAENTGALLSEGDEKKLAKKNCLANISKA